MKKLIWFTLSILSLSAVVRACGGYSLTGSTNGKIGVIRTEISVNPFDTSRKILQSDSGKTIHLKAGETLAWAFRDFYTWKPEVSDSSILEVNRDASVSDNSKGLIRGIKPGKGEFKAIGDPKCYPACKAASILFTITVIVDQ
jgi:hypothetical protein